MHSKSPHESLPLIPVFCCRCVFSAWWCLWHFRQACIIQEGLYISHFPSSVNVLSYQQYPCHSTVHSQCHTNPDVTRLIKGNKIQSATHPAGQKLQKQPWTWNKSSMTPCPSILTPTPRLHAGKNSICTVFPDKSLYWLVLIIPFHSQARALESQGNQKVQTTQSCWLSWCSSLFGPYIAHLQQFWQAHIIQEGLHVSHFPSSENVLFYQQHHHHSSPQSMSPFPTSHTSSTAMKFNLLSTLLARNSRSGPGHRKSRAPPP